MVQVIDTGQLIMMRFANNVRTLIFHLRSSFLSRDLNWGVGGKFKFWEFPLEGPEHEKDTGKMN